MLKSLVLIACLLAVPGIAATPEPIQNPALPAPVSPPEQKAVVQIQGSNRSHTDSGNKIDKNQTQSKKTLSTPIERQSTPPKHESENYAQNLADYTDRIATFTELLFWATSILAFIAFINAVAFIRSERAFVGVESVQFDAQKLTYDLPLILKIVAKNGGSGWAFIEDLSIVLRATDKPLPVKPKYDSGNPHLKGHLLSGMQMTGSFGILENGTPCKMPSSEAPKVNDGTIKIYAFGYVEYRDAFTIFRNRKTGFCLIYDPGTGLFNQHGTKEYAYAK